MCKSTVKPLTTMTLLSSKGIPKGVRIASPCCPGYIHCSYIAIRAGRQVLDIGGDQLDVHFHEVILAQSFARCHCERMGEYEKAEADYKKYQELTENQ